MINILFIRRKLLCIVLLVSLNSVYADTNFGFNPDYQDSIMDSHLGTSQGDDDKNINAMYISAAAYLQNPYANVASGGGEQIPNVQNMESENFWQKWFANGTYNVYSGATTTVGSGKANPTGAYNGTSVYGTNAFAQTGQAAGFSIGGGLTVMNPFFANQINGNNVNGSLLAPTNKQIALTQAFVEYQHENIVNVDAGFISINNSPWLPGSYFNNSVNVPVTYQGMLANVYPGDGWLLTALAFNGIQSSGQNGFSNETLLNSKYGVFYQTNNTASNATVAVGANYKTDDNNYNLRLWAYRFDNYGTLLYGDNSVNISLSNLVKLSFSAQAGIDNNFGAPTAYNNPLDASLGVGNSINSSFVGLQGGVTIDWFNLTLSGNTIWGPSSAIGGGAIVSPYTANLGADPLYSEGWQTSMVNTGLTGNIYKASTTFNFLDNNLSFSQNYILLSNSNPNWNGTQEAFFTLGYSIPQVKGLYLYGVYSYQWLPIENPSSGGQWTSEALVSYLW